MDIDLELDSNLEMDMQQDDQLLNYDNYIADFGEPKTN